MRTKIYGSGRSVTPPTLNSYSTGQEQTTGRLFTEGKRVTFGVISMDQNDVTQPPGVKPRYFWEEKTRVQR